MDERTPSQIAYDEQQETIASILDAGLPLTSESNTSVENNTNVEGTDSQGIPDSLLRRNVIGASQDQATHQAYELYAESDPFASVEANDKGGVRYDGGGGYF